MGIFAPIAGAGLGVLQRTGALDKLLSKLGFQPDVWILQVDRADLNRGASAEDNAIVSQTAPENITWTLSGQTSRRKMVGDYAPPTMPAGGDPETCTFSATFVASHAYEDLRPLRNAMEALWKRDANLGRRPVCLFTYGGKTFRCYLSSLTTRTPQGHWYASGNPIAYQFDLTLEAANHRSLDRTVPGAPERETSYWTLKAGENVDLVAWQMYGDASLGPKVRQINASMYPEPVTGDRLRLLDRTHSEMQGAVKPRAIPFATSAGVARLEALAQLRLEDAVDTVPGVVYP